MSKMKYYVGCLNQEYRDFDDALIDADVYTYVNDNKGFAVHYPKGSKCTPAMLMAELYRAQQLGYEIIFLDAEQHKRRLEDER